VCQAEVAVNWCPALGTVLANEEVIDGLSERGNHPVVRKVRFLIPCHVSLYVDSNLSSLTSSMPIHKLFQL
jgi:leucyl-tRNA synthetase